MMLQNGFKVFDVPRATKIPHREEQRQVPKFQENAEPLLQFASDSENIFNPARMAGKVESNDSERESQEAAADQKVSLEEFTAS